MSFFELDGGAKKRAPAKKASGKKKTTSGKKSKKGGNFLGTVSELFAPAGWENFVTAAGLLALDRTDNFLRKSKDSKKQKGGADEEVKMEEMDGGARKRSSSRKQRGGSDSHHTVEYLDAVGGEEPVAMSQTDTTSQTGGGKKRSKSKGKTGHKGHKGHKGGDMSNDEKTIFLSTYHRQPEEAMKLIKIYDTMNISNIPNNNGRTNAIIRKVIATHSQSVVPETIERNNMGIPSTGINTYANQASKLQAKTLREPEEQEQDPGLFNGGKPKSKPKAKKSTKGRK